MSNNKQANHILLRTNVSRCIAAAAVLAGAALWTTTAQSQVLAYVATDRAAPPVFQSRADRVGPPPFQEAAPSTAPAPAAVAAAYQITPAAGNSASAYAPNESADDGALSARLHRQIVDYPSSEAPGTIIVDTPNTYLYFVLGGGKAMRYGIGVGREGFTWSGVKTIERKTEWPDWFPPSDMLARQPYLPRFMAGGPGNPLGARAMYLGGTVYRIHGTNAPSTIGKHVSSGCIRMVNDDVIDLFGRTHVGTKVIVMPMRPVVGMR
jgi:lipoprotein-anchoring transpeptidase ErfK/SrfK